MNSFLILIACACGTPNADLRWPDFRGPGGQGMAEATGLPTHWGEEENVVWKSPLPGRGWSTPIVQGGHAWMTTALDEGTSLRALAVELTSGRLAHDVEVFHPNDPVGINAKNSHASPSPVADEGFVFVHYGTMGTACLDARGAIVWTNQDLRLDHKEGPGSSPVLWKDLLIVTGDGMDVQFLAALDKRTGAVVWKSERPKPIHDNPDFCKAYSTPLVVQVNGRDELISSGAMQTISYDPASGRELWKVRYDGFSNVPRPLFGQGMFFICTGFMRPQLWAVRPGGEGDVSASHVVWKQSRQVPANPSPILVDRHIYMTSNTGVLSCVEAATGEVVWTHRLGGNFSSSPILADGKLFFSSEEGITTVIQPAATYKELARNQLAGGIMASPVAFGRTLLLRTDQALYRIEQAREEQQP